MQTNPFFTAFMVKISTPTLPTAFALPFVAVRLQLLSSFFQGKKNKPWLVKTKHDFGKKSNAEVVAKMPFCNFTTQKDFLFQENNMKQDLGFSIQLIDFSGA